MAVFGIGATFGKVDKMQEFIQERCACIGWAEEEAPALYQMMRKIKVGDLIYIKAFPPKVGLIIKAVGIVTNAEVTKPNFQLGKICIKEVDWAWRGNYHWGKVDDKYNVRSITLYEEFNPRILNLVIDALRGRIKKLGGEILNRSEKQN